jgi:hypothetical protein
MPPDVSTHEITDDYPGGTRFEISFLPFWL